MLANGSSPVTAAWKSCVTSAPYKFASPLPKSMLVRLAIHGHRPIWSWADMVMGPDTLVHIRDWRAKALFGADVATVKAKRLIDGEFVSEISATTMTFYELIFDRQHIVYVDGLEVVSTAL